MADHHSSPPELKSLDNFSTLLDSQFRIPGTNTRFGVDFIIGLIPYAGDLISFLFSGGLVLTMAKHGASGQVLAKMLWNIVLDTVVGSVPLFGDIFDLYYKSNRRNYNLLKEHYGEGEYQGSMWRVVLPILLVLIALFVLMIWLVFRVAAFGWGMIFG